MSIELHIGLAPGRYGFYDEHTRVNLTGANRHTRLSLPDGTNLQGLARGLFTMTPAIVLFEGEFPESEKQKFLDGYNYKLAVIDRAARIVSNAPAATGAITPDPEAPVEEPPVEDAPEEVGAQSVGAATLLDIEEEPKEEAPTTKKTRSKTTK